MEDIKAGDKVRLKSGGPVMTVNNATIGGFYCYWFDIASLCNGVFAAAALELVPEGSVSRPGYLGQLG